MPLFGLAAFLAPVVGPTVGSSDWVLETPRSDRVGRAKKPPPIREAAFASLKAPLQPVRASVDPTDASEEGEAPGR